MATGTPAGTIIDNQATVVYTTADSASHHVAYGNRLSFTIGQRAVVNLTPAVATKSARLGDVVDYAAVVTNSGNGADSFLVYGASSLGLAVGIYHDANRDGLLSAAEIGAGPLGVTEILPADSSVWIIARLWIRDSAALNGTSDLLTVTATSLFDRARYATGLYTTEIMSASLLVAKGVNNPTPQPSSHVTYTITCNNAGSARAEEIVITDVLHPKLRYVTGSAAPDPAAVAGQTMTWKLAALDPGASAVITFRVEVDEGLAPGMVVHNSADVTYEDGAIPRTTSSTELSFITIAAGGTQTVTIGPDGSEIGESGDTAAYPLTVTNTSVGGREFELRANSTKGIPWIFIKDINGNGIEDGGEPAVTSTGVIAGGGEAKFVARGRLPAVASDRTVDSTRFIARSTSNQNNLAQCLGRTTIGRPVMTLRKSATAPNPISGGEITYRIEYMNKGSGRAERFRVVDSLPENTSFVDGSIRLNSVPKTELADSDEATISNATLSVDVGAVAADTSGIIEFKVKID